jgi:YihY family inner membrane protein
MSDKDKAPKPPRSLYDRYMAARNWIWSSWTDEAVLIYRRSARGGKRAHVLWVESLLFLREILREFYIVQGTNRAASLAYTTLLSLIPLIVALSQILRSYFSTVFPDFRSQIDTFLNIILPYQSSQVAGHINRFVENATEASTFGAIIFLVISFRLFMAVEATINDIWKVQSARGYRQKIRAFTMLLFWGPLLIGLSFTTSASLERNEYLNAIFQNAFIIRLVPAIVMFIAFTMLFWLVPSTRVWFKSAVIGALVTTVLFELVRWGFGIYAEHLFKGNLNVIYGALGLAVLFLIALDLMWVVILIGVEVSYVHQNLPGILRASEEQLEEDARYDLYFALRALIEVSRLFTNREDAPSSYRLAEEFGATDRQMLSVLRRLEDAKLIKEIGGDWTGFAPGCDPDQISVDEVVKVMEGGYRDIPQFDDRRPEMKLLADLFTTLQRCTSEALGRLSIGYLVRQLEGTAGTQRIGDPLRAVSSIPPQERG